MNDGIFYFFIEKKGGNVKVIDTYQFNKEDFLNNIISTLVEQGKNKKKNRTNIFCICGEKEKVKRDQDIIANEIGKTYKDIANHNIFPESYNHIHDNDMLYEFANIFSNYTLENGLFPNVFSIQFNGIYVCCFYGDTSYLKEPPKKITELIETWIIHSDPILLGKQLFTKSFYFETIVGRKTCGLFTHPVTHVSYLLLEGGVKLELGDYDTLSMVDSSDTNSWTVFDIQNIVYNPIYTYGIWLEPFIAFQDWFNIYLYIIALLPTDLEDLKKLEESYELFLNYIQENICEKINDAPTMIPKDVFFETLRVNILNIRKTLKGEEEIDVSKNFILKIKNRWLYLDEMTQLLLNVYNQEYIDLNKITILDQLKWNQLLNKINVDGNYEKGHAFEDLAEYFLSCIKGIKITGRNIKYFTEEIDLCFCTYANDSVLWKMGALVLVECKNRTPNISTSMIRNMSQIMDSKGAYTTILFTRSKLGKPAKEEIEKVERLGKHFIVITLDELINMQTTPIELLKRKINETIS